MPLDALANIAAMTKACTQRAAGICGDDVAVNTKQLMGLERGRGVPATLKVIKGSLLNKAILIPVALTVSAFAPWAVLPMLAVGGLHLASEGARNLLGKGHGHGHGHEGHDHDDHPHDAKGAEKDKIRGALTVDFILSAEITVLTLSMIAALPLVGQLAVLAGTGAAMTLGMYGLIGGLVNMKDVGTWLEERKGDNALAKTARGLGKGIGKVMPHIMKGISFAGTVALFIIGGELLLHGIPGAEHMVANAVGTIVTNPAIQGAASFVAETAIGLAAGFMAMPVMDKLEPKIDQAADWVKKQFAKLKERCVPKQKQSASAPKAPAPAPQLSPSKLKDIAVANDLNKAAQKPANDAAPVPPAQKPAAPKP
jgi:uncharacterized protein